MIIFEGIMAFADKDLLKVSLGFQPLFLGVRMGGSVGDPRPTSRPQVSFTQPLEAPGQGAESPRGGGKMQKLPATWGVSIVENQL